MLLDNILTQQDTFQQEVRILERIPPDPNVLVDQEL